MQLVTANESADGERLKIFYCLAVLNNVML
jgi:hypothetical protein